MRHLELKKKISGDYLWNPSYYVGTAGQVSNDAIRQYIEAQKTEKESDSVPLITLEVQVRADPQAEAILEDAMFCATRVYNILKKLPRAEGY
ncbi:hypothetical protein AS159_06970 [Thermotoga sp. Ku-13t]|nr:hypothetical protein AS159_06970 [Thermotoga sp. Ku-13t]